MPPRPYLPIGTLRSAIFYPFTSDNFPEHKLEDKLAEVGLDYINENLDVIDSWDNALSAEEQQRLGVVRLLLQKPKWILLQQAFDSLNSNDEVAMMRLICQSLPNSAILTISNESHVDMFHQRTIVL
jgi:putative ATP-binding cassette transporter